MRWDALFADMAGRLDADEAAQWRAEVSARERSERASVTLADRCAAALGATVRLRTVDGAWCQGDLRDVADEWVLMGDDLGREHVIPLRAVDAVEGLGAAAAHRGAVERRLTLAHALRALARDRARVSVVTRTGQAAGLVVAVGADHADVADRAATVTVPLVAIVRVSSQDAR
ncbi:hypothetical protein [Demequina sp. NBRC 110057]|uniref:hypothetical protein n=1 Tax=Demequina sp. NBRC 110057 TaxID=1570346 RepID=UPI000A034376|nr:hypothetical protein [Demequina sp. NBRC 110057]